MRSNHTLMILALGGLVVVGCAKNDMRTSRAGHSGLNSMADVSPGDVKEDKPPKILPETYFRAAQLFESQGQFARALGQYQKAVATNHKYTGAYHRLGLLYDRLGRHEEAAQALAEAAELDPTNPTIENNLGFAYAQMRNWEQAERHFRRARDLKPDFDRATVNHGMALAHLGRFKEAFDAFQTCLPDTDAYYNIGLMFRAQNRFQDAAYAFNESLRLDPQFGAAGRQLDEISVRVAAGNPNEPTTDFSTWGRQRGMGGTMVASGLSGATDASASSATGSDGRSMASSIVGAPLGRFGQPKVYSQCPTRRISMRSAPGARSEADQMALIQESASGQTALALYPQTRGAQLLFARLGAFGSASALASSGYGAGRPQPVEPCEEEEFGEDQASSLAATIISDEFGASESTTIEATSRSVPRFHGYLRAMHNLRRISPTNLSESQAPRKDKGAHTTPEQQ